MTVILSISRLQRSDRIWPGVTACGLAGAWPHRLKPLAGMRSSTTTPTCLSGDCDPDVFVPPLSILFYSLAFIQGFNKVAWE
jgi:hypothetical protein